MTWNIAVDGHDDLEQEAKAAFENGLIAKVKQLVEDIQSGAGITISRAVASTNTTGQVDLLAPDSADAADADPADPDLEEPADDEEAEAPA